MSKELTVKMGVKVPQSEFGSLDPNERGAFTVTPPPSRGDVEAQEAYFGRMTCPHCYALGYGWMDTDFYKWFNCHNCGLPFRA